MKKNILIGTHHKTGTVWLGSVFRVFAKLMNIEFYNISKSYIDPDEKKNLFKHINEFNSKAIYFDHHSKFPDIPIKNKHLFKGIHIIRDPKDVLISGTLYHAWSEEKWLHIPQDKFNGMTYQEKINAFDNIEDKIEFEMNYSSKNTIKSMVNFKTKNIYLNIKFETLMIDKYFDEVMNIAKHLELEGEEIIFLFRAFYNESLFGKKGNVKKKHIQPKVKKDEYKDILELILIDKFNDEFGYDRFELGYTV